MKNYCIRALAATVLLSAASGIDAREFTTASGRCVDVSFYTPDVVKVTNRVAFGEGRRVGSVVLRPGDVAVSETVLPDGRVMLVSATGVSATVDPRSGAVDISAGGDRSVSDSGLRTIDGDRRTMSLSTMGGGSFYGAGERGYSLNLAGDTLVMYNKQNYGYTAGEKRIRQMNITMPLFVSSAGYAVLFDDHAAAEMVMSNPIVYTTTAPSPVDFYFINGHGSMPRLSEELSALTGRQDLPPFWSLGYITSKYGYHDEAETRGVVDTLHREGYPVDGLVLDLYWYGKEQDMGRLAWDPVQWPDHRKMLADLKKQGVNTVIISQPYILRNGRGADNYNELASQGLLAKGLDGKPREVKIWVGEGGMFDVSNPETRAWLRERYRTLTDEGVTGWWGDLGEPEVHPDSIIHHNGLTTGQYHNRYGNDWSSIIYDLFTEEYPETRLMTMMRGGTTGLQRYSVFPWSTDVSRSWGGLRPQITIMLNSGLSGLGYMGHDVGGFAIDPAHPYDPELYVRWLQLGAFSPVLRTHAQATAEPYHYPEQKDIILPLIRDRYTWLPYNYTLAWENATRGLPLVRPTGYHDTAAGFTPDLDDQYLWGRDILVAPVLEKGAVKRSVTFPEGRWIDMRDAAKVYDGGSTIEYDAPLEVLPLFVRAGSFIPRADYAMGNTGDYTTARYRIDYYPVEGVEITSQIFEDDRTSRGSLSRGEYALVTLTGRDTAEGITVNVKNDGTYPRAPARKKLTLVVNNVDAPASVTVDGRRLKGKAVKYSAADRTLTLALDWTVASPMEIFIAR